VIGNDIFGRELISQLQNLKVDTSTVIVQPENFDTQTYAKRLIDDIEEPRIDFGFLINAPVKSIHCSSVISIMHLNCDVIISINRYMEA